MESTAPAVELTASTQQSRNYFDRILKLARRHSASDVHLIRGLPPVLRINGDITPIQAPPIESQQLNDLLDALANSLQKETFHKTWQLCFSMYWPSIGRFRASVYLHSGVPEFSIRLCEEHFRTREELGLPTVVEELTRRPNGLILVTGPTGVGKTTTMSYMINTINHNRRAKIVTIEDPIEFVHENRLSIVVQQEVMTDVTSFRAGLTHVLRQDPDVIVIGEMRDLETIETALVAAETGHLVLATLHTPDSVQTIQRIFSVFPPSQQHAIVQQLANSLQAIIAQKLLPKANGEGRVLACEVCVATPAVRNQIREMHPHLLYSEMQPGKKHQMQTMDQSLLNFYLTGEITYDTAISNAREPNTIKHKTAAV